MKEASMSYDPAELAAVKVLTRILGAEPISEQTVFQAEYEALQARGTRKARPQPRKTWARGLKDAARARDDNRPTES